MRILPNENEDDVEWDLLDSEGRGDKAFTSPRLADVFVLGERVADQTLYKRHTRTRSSHTHCNCHSRNTPINILTLNKVFHRKKKQQKKTDLNR